MIPSELGQIGPITIRTYTLLVDLAILVGLGVLAWQGHVGYRRAGVWMDAGIGALVGGLVIGRLVHVLIYWAYFSEHANQTYQIWRGGIDWHGAVIGGLIGLAVVGRWRGVSFEVIAGVIAILLPIGAIMIYLGCYSMGCGYGREVESLADYPPMVVGELPDLFGVVAPRFASPLYGIIASVMVLIVVLVSRRWIKRGDVLMWLALGLLGLAAFGIGFTRGDSMWMVGALRLDQVLDLNIVAISVVMIVLLVLPFKIGRFYGPVGLTRK